MIVSAGVLAACAALVSCGADPVVREPAPPPVTSPAPVTFPAPVNSPTSLTSPTSAATPADQVPETADPPTPTADPAFEADTHTDSLSPSGTGGLTVTEVRAARHDGYDRVVFELAGPGDAQAGWTVGYTDDPRTQGEGAVVDLPGEATLSVLLTGTSYPADTGAPAYDSSRLLLGDGLALVTDVSYGGTFEGQDDAFVGVRTRVPFRVFRLSSPERVVIDLRG